MSNCLTYFHIIFSRENFFQVRDWSKSIEGGLTKFVDTLLQPISKGQKSYLSLKRQI